MFNNLIELMHTMPTEQDCRDYFQKQRWPEGKPYCIHCGSSKVYSLTQGKRFECGEKLCGKRFSLTCGTVFEGSKIGLKKWFLAVYLCINNKKGISSHQLAKHIGVTQKTGWFMLHRIRKIAEAKEDSLLTGTVEVDETFCGAIVGNMHKATREKYRTESGGTIQNKTMVVGMLERSGQLRLVALGKQTGKHIVQPVVRNNVSKDAVIFTDASHNYADLSKEYAGHEIVNHSEHEYVRNKVIHTNSIEGVFSMLKRSIIGVYHHASPKHLNRYCAETSYRYNTRELKDASRFTLSLQNAAGRLKYQDLIANPAQDETTAPYPTYKEGRTRVAVYQVKNGKIVAQYSSVKLAAQVTGLKAKVISKVLRGERKATGGFGWQYV